MIDDKDHGSEVPTPLSDMIQRDDNMLEEILPQNTDSVATQLADNLDVQATSDSVSVTDSCQF